MKRIGEIILTSLWRKKEKTTRKSEKISYLKIGAKEKKEQNA